MLLLEVRWGHPKCSETPCGSRGGDVQMAVKMINVLNTKSLFACACK